MLFLPQDDIEVTYQENGDVIGTSKVFSGGWPLKDELVGSFNGLQRIINYAKQNMKHPKHERKSNGNGSFYHFRNYDEALDTYQNHPEQVLEFDENDVRLEGGDAGGLDIQYDTTGDFIDIDRYLSGEPECFGSMDNGVPRGQRMTIVYGTAWSGSTNKKLIVDRGRRISRLIDWLESQGIRCQVIAISSMECQHIETLVKHYDEPLALTDIAVTSHTDYFRRLIFRFAEYSETWRTGYGSSLSFDRAVREYNYSTLPNELKDGHMLYCGVQNQSSVDRVFDDLETQLATVLSDPQHEPQMFRVMV